MSNTSVLKLVLILALLCGCTSADSGSIQERKTESIAQELVSELKMTDEVESVKDRIVKGMLFGGEDLCTDYAVYMPSEDSNTDIVGVFITEDVRSCMSCLQEWLTERKIEMQNYYPSQVFKISNAVLESSKDQNMVILVVCEDIEKAKELAQQILGS